MNKIILEGNILNKVFQNSNFSQNQKNSNLFNAVKIYEKVPNSINNFESNVGLVVGKVQSGKTANIITLTALAFDNDCKLVIMLLSDTNSLLTQNYERIASSFKDCEDVVVFKESSDGQFAAIGEEQLKKLYKRDKKIIICSLKHYAHIKNLYETIKNTGYRNDYSLIIDDEGDDISQNTSKNKFGMGTTGNIEENERTRNNKEIVNLKATLEKCGYISLTATPEAPVFLQTFQALSPNYCVTLKPGIGYSGLLTFHQTDSKYIKEIDDYNCLIEDRGIPNSLMDAISFFFAGCIYTFKNKGKKVIHSMMIHPSKTIVAHDNVYKKLSQRLKLLEHNLLRKEESGKDFFEQVSYNYKIISNLNEEISYDDLLYVIDNYNINNINGKQIEKDINNLITLFPYNIFIGGDLLDRGITIPNLAVSYIIRDSKKGQVDTLLQRARWFGYKEEYLETCKIYMPSLLANKYNEIIDTEESLWEFLDECSDMNYDLKNCRFSLDINSSILNPTSNSKASYEFGYANVNSIRQQKNFTINNDFNNENLILVRSFDWEKSYKLDYNNVQKHRYINIDLSRFDEFISKYHFSDYNNEQSDCLNKDLIVKYIHENIARYGNTVSLVDMRYEYNEERSVYNENCIRNLLQGRSEGKVEGDKDFYYGDRYLPEMKNKISIQIHHVKLKINNSNYYKYGDEVIMLVLCMPKDFVIKNYVIRKDISDANRIY